jgi:tRNA1Val (adenine37-N6)-methyltransferase
MSKESALQPFIFKQFSVAQDRVAMKVGTDGVLIGAWAQPGAHTTVLDIGTGTGLIALIMAQKIGPGARIHAVDIDPQAIEQARENFDRSPWPACFTLHHESIQDFASTAREKMDLIISNPPFFTGGFLSENQDRNRVRHATKLPHGELLLSVDRLLDKNGQLVLVLPYLQGLRFMEICQIYRLYPARICEVYTKSDKPCERLLIEFRRIPSEPVRSSLVIHTADGSYSDEYRSLTAAFYLHF